MPKSTKSNSFWDHPIETIEEALSIRKQIEGLQGRLSRVLGGTSTALGRAIKGRKRMSPQARAKIAAAARARWAKAKGKSAKTVKTTPKATKTKTAKAPKKKRGLTPEGRAKLAAAMKARWAAKKKGASAQSASSK